MFDDFKLNYISAPDLSILLILGYSCRNPDMAGWGHGISRDFERKSMRKFQGSEISKGLGFWPCSFQDI